MGKYNSSLTRVVPVFDQLIRKDRSGVSWLKELLDLFPNRETFLSEVWRDPGPISRICFGNQEFCLDPPLRFLRWMVEHPEELSWPRYEVRDPHIRDMRERLVGRGTYKGNGQARCSAVQDAVAEIENALREPPDNPPRIWQRRWWVLEGQTHVDCFIETPKVRLFVEGKRTDKLSAGTSWYQGRNQLLRNLEAASAFCGSRPFVQLLIVEHPQAELPSSIVEASLPHLKSEERQKLLQHYAGSVTWQDVCDALDIRYDLLPETVGSPPNS